MKKNFLVAFISILIISTMAYATSYVIHDYDTGVMHMAQDIYLTNTNSVQTQIDSIETNLNGSYALKSGTLSQFTGGTNLNQIATRNHSDLQNINGSESYQHLTTAEVSNITLKSGSITQITTRNHNDLQNLNATSAHPSASIDNTSTSYGKGLSTTDNTVQKVADRVNQNGTPQFVTDKTKCSLLLDFKGTLADRSRAINPIGSDAANKWTDNFVNDSTSKEVATNISCTFKQFDGDEGKFGSGVAVEESRTNLLRQSDDLTSATWVKGNCTVTLDRTLADGRKLFKVVASGGNAEIYQSITYGVSSYTMSAFVVNATGKNLALWNSGSPDFAKWLSSDKLVRKHGTINLPVGHNDMCGVVLYSATAGDTFYITSPQVEAGSFPTSYIATGATAVTRPTGKIKFDPNILNGKTDFTISFWAKPNFNYDITTVPTLFQFSMNSSIYWNVYYAPSQDKFYCTLGSGSAEIPQTSAYTNNINLQKEHHFVIKQSGANADFYIDDVLQGSIANAITPIVTEYFEIGYNRYYTDREANTDISNFAIFNYALTADEISQIYNSGLEGKPIAITNPETIIPVGQSLYDTLFVTYASGWGISTTYPNKPTFSNHDGVAMLRGIVEFAGVVNSDVTLFTLPVGARPSLPDTYYHSFVTTARDSGSPAMRILRVYGNGDVVLMAQGATITNPALSLDNINFVNGK